MLRIKRNFKKIIIVLLIVIIPILFYLLLPFHSNFINDDYSTVVLDEEGEMLRIFLNSKEQWRFPSGEQLTIPEKLKTCVIYYEDRYFYHHCGFNPVSLIRALYLNIKYKKIISGGSTISMQVIRLLNLKTRTYFHKFIEIIQAIKLEIHYSKEKILQLYLVNAPYGGNILGFRAASLKYFRKMPEQLTWSEAAILAVLPNSPGLIRINKNHNKLIQKRNRLLKKLYKNNVINRETYELSLKEPIPSKINKFKITAAHISERLKNQSTENIIHSTINKKLQQDAENIIKEHAQYLQKHGIRNIAAMVTETKTRKVRVYIGSQDFFDEKNNGQVDGIIAPRSTGSILKPFLYALSFDDGIILPQTLIKDVPTFYGSFTPINANQKYNGLVTAKEALIRSLNVPAVRLLNKYGVFSFYQFLKTAGVSTLFRNADDYGLTLIIGGSEITLFDLTKLYSGLANYGKFQPLLLTEFESEKINNYKFPNLISPAACYLTLNILKEVHRPGNEYYWHQYENQYPLAWKTGTSYGQRDAWAVGVNPEWTIAVWVGNFTGEINPGISGASCAGPILFDIFNSLPKNSNLTWFKIPLDNIKAVKICKETGFLAGENCPNSMMVMAPSGMKPLKKCPYHKRIYVTKDEKYQVCSLCWEQGNYKKKEVLVYPPDVVQYLRERGQTVSNLPLHKKNCPGQKELHSLEIIYPTQNAKLWIPKDINGSLQKVTVRIVNREKESTVFWYLDNIYIGKTDEKHSKAIQVFAGKHHIEVIDEDGNQDSKIFYVRTKRG